MAPGCATGCHRPETVFHQKQNVPLGPLGATHLGRGSPAPIFRCEIKTQVSVGRISSADIAEGLKRRLPCLLGMS